MMDYNHWAALGVLGEILPWEDNRVELADETDGHGIRVAKITFSMRDNDKKVARFGVEKATEIMYAAGAEEVVEEPRYAHLVGGARMGNDPRRSVTDSFGRTHAIPNLFICDGSLLPTQGSANPRPDNTGAGSAYCRLLDLGGWLRVGSTTRRSPTATCAQESFAMGHVGKRCAAHQIRSAICV